MDIRSLLQKMTQLGESTQSKTSLNEGKRENRELWDKINKRGTVPSIDRERYTDMSGEGLEGPFRTKIGKVVYYDTKAGKYYDRDSDMYIDGGHEMFEDGESFAKGDRVMYNNTFATVVGQDGDSYVVKVDGQPNTMKVPATAIKKPSYNEDAGEMEEVEADANAAADGLDEERSEVKDKSGKVVSWRDESEWTKSDKKDPRGKVTHMSDVARRETGKLNKVKDMAEGEDLAWDDPDLVMMRKMQADKAKKKPAVVKTKDEIGFRVSDVGPGGRESNVKTDAAWDRKHGVKEGDMSSRIGDKGETIRRHTAKAGGYGRKIDTPDDSGDRFHSSDIDDTDTPAIPAAAKRGRGRPQKGGDSETGITKKYDTDALASWIIGNKPKNIGSLGTSSVKHKLKDWMEHVERKTIVEGFVAEGKMSELSALIDDIVDGQIDIYDIVSGNFKPASELEKFAQDTLIKSYDEIAGERGLHADDDFEKIIEIMYNEIHDIMTRALNGGEGLGEAEQVSIVPAQTQAQVIKQGSNVLGQVNDPKLAGVIKQAIGTGQMTLAGGQAMKENRQSKKKVMEGTLEEIIQLHPHEHKMCQEGWGMDESLYEALADHYFKEGRIPRKVWHGDLEELRKHVEECYLQDTQTLMGEDMIDEDGIFTDIGQVAGTVAGSAGGPVGSFVGRQAGAALGGAIDDAIGEEAKTSRELRRGAMAELTRDLDEEFSKITGLMREDLEDEVNNKGISALHADDADTFEKGGDKRHVNRNPISGFMQDDEYEVDTPKKSSDPYTKVDFKIEESAKRKSEDNKAEKAGKRVTKDLEYDMKHKGKDDKKAEKAGKKVTKDIEYDEKKEQLDELDKSTLQSYKDKVHGSIAKKYNAGDDDGVSKRLTGLGKASQRLAGVKSKNTTTEATDSEQIAHDLSTHKRKLAREKNRAEITGMMQADHPTKKSGEKEMAKINARNRDVVKESFLDWDNQLSSLLKEEMTITTSQNSNHEHDSVNITATDEHASALMNIIQNAGLGADLGTNSDAGSEMVSFDDSDGHSDYDGEIEVMEDAGYNPSIYAQISQGEQSDGTGSPAATTKRAGSDPHTKFDDAEDVPVMAMPRGMGMSQNTDGVECHVVEPQMNDEVIDQLSSGAEEADDSGEGALDFLKKMLKHGEGTVSVVQTGNDGQFADSMPTSRGASSGYEEEVGEAMDPVGKEDDDIDNDGDSDSSDKYLKNRREKISQNMDEGEEMCEACGSQLHEGDCGEDYIGESVDKNLSQLFLDHFSNVYDNDGTAAAKIYRMVAKKYGENVANDMDQHSDYSFNASVTRGNAAADAAKKADQIRSKYKLDREAFDESANYIGEYAQSTRREPTIGADPMRSGGSRSDGSDRLEPRYTGPKIKSAPLSRSDDSMRSTSIRPRYMEEDEENPNTDEVAASGQENGELQKAGAMAGVEGATNESRTYEVGDFMKRLQSIEGRTLKEWANSPTGESQDEQFQTDMEFMTKSISGGLNNQKQDQTLVGSGPTRVVTQTERADVKFDMGSMLKKLGGIN